MLITLNKALNIRQKKSPSLSNKHSMSVFNIQTSGRDLLSTDITQKGIFNADGSAVNSIPTPMEHKKTSKEKFTMKDLHINLINHITINMLI